MLASTNNQACVLLVMVFRAQGTQANLELLKEKYTDLRKLKILNASFIHYFQTNEDRTWSITYSEKCDFIIDVFGFVNH